QGPNVGGIAPPHAVDFAARVRLPPRQTVHLAEHQADVRVRGIERGRPWQLGFGLARASLAQVDEAQVGVPERLLGREGHDLAELGFGAWQLLLLLVSEAPGPGRERRVAPRLVRAGRRSPA